MKAIIFMSLLFITIMTLLPTAMTTTSSTAQAQLNGNSNDNNNQLAGFAVSIYNQQLDLCTPYAKHMNDTYTYTTPDHYIASQTCGGVLANIKKSCDVSSAIELRNVCSDPRFQDWLLHYFDASINYDTYPSYSPAPK